MISSDCPRQQAFMEKLNELIFMEAEQIYGCDTKQIFQEEYIHFVNLWCPTFKEYQGCKLTKT